MGLLIWLGLLISLCIVTFCICMSSNIQIDQNCMQIHMRSLCHKAYLFSFFFQLILLDVIKLLDLVIWFLIWFGEPMWHTHIYFWYVLIFQANSKETKRFFVPFYAILWPCEVVGILTQKKKKVVGIDSIWIRVVQTDFCFYEG